MGGVSPAWDAPVRRCVEVVVTGPTPPGKRPVVGVVAKKYLFAGKPWERGQRGAREDAFWLSRPLKPGPRPGTWILPRPLLTVGEGGAGGLRDRSVYPLFVVPVPEDLALEIAADPNEPPVYDAAHLTAADIHRKDMHSVDVIRMPDATRRCP